MAASMQNVPRFTVMNDDDLEEFMECTDSKNTKKQIKYGLSIFKEYCELCNVKFEDLPNKEICELDKLLSQFYAGARSQKGEA